MSIVKRLMDVFEASRAPIAKEAADEIARLNQELQNRDKCSYMGPMRGCPTHGESADLAALRHRLQEIGDLAASSRTGPGLREVLAEIERMSTETTNQEMSMSEVEQLKRQIDASGREGIETAHIRDDYEPAGAMMIRDICATGDYVQRKVPPGGFDQKWKVFKKGVEPY